MNVAGLPDEHNPRAFAIVCVLMVVIAIIPWVFLGGDAGSEIAGGVNCIATTSLVKCLRRIQGTRGPIVSVLVKKPDR